MNRQENNKKKKDNKPYIEHKPGELLTSDDWNQMQIMIKEDINGLREAMDNIKLVATAENALRLDNKTLEEIKEEIIREVIKRLP